LLRPSRTEYSFQLVAPEDVKNPHHSSAIIPSLCPTGREMMSAQLPSPAEPTGNRFVVVTPDDHSASLIIVAILFLIYSCLLFAVRILVVKRKRHGWDDGILGWAYVKVPKSSSGSRRSDLNPAARGIRAVDINLHCYTLWPRKITFYRQYPRSKSHGTGKMHCMIVRGIS
jgi:hypothetical protein